MPWVSLIMGLLQLAKALQDHATRRGLVGDAQQRLLADLYRKEADALSLALSIRADASAVIASGGMPDDGYDRDKAR